MQKLLGMALVLVGMSALAMAIPAFPEIDAASGVQALALLAGAALVIRARRTY